MTNKQAQLTRMYSSQGKNIKCFKYFLITIRWESTLKRNSSKNWKKKINSPKFLLIKQELTWMNSNPFTIKNRNAWPIQRLIFTKFYQKGKSSFMLSNSLWPLSTPTKNLDFTLIIVFSLYFISFSLEFNS